MPVPAAVHLIEFAPAPGGGARTASLAGQAVDHALPEDDADSDFARGREEGMAAAAAEHAARLEEERNRTAAELAEARAAWVAEEGERIAALLNDAVGALEARIGDAVAEILAPFLSDEVRRTALDDLAGILSQMLRDGKHPALRIDGPADLLAAIKERLGDADAAVTFGDSASASDVRAVASDTVIETEIGAWLSRIQGQAA